MRIEIGYGTGMQTVDLPDKHIADVLTPNPITSQLTGTEEVRRALEQPIGAPLLRDIVQPGETIAIITSDITRPMPSYKVLPAVLDELEVAGTNMEDVTVYFALGSHRKHTEAERKQIAGQAFERVRCIDGDPDDVVHLGITKRGTPVDIVRGVAKADRRICLGNIEYHYFAGYSGGAKAIMPGVSTPSAISNNHKFMVEDSAHAGKLAGNPVREDIEEAAALCGVDYIVNVVLDAQKEIVYAVAGDVTAAHREGCRFLDGLYRKNISEQADIVLVSQGGAPKDLNLYQTQKALDNAKHAVRNGGTIILVGACQEGLGNRVFEEWFKEAECPDDLIERVHKNFCLGGHKAAAIALVQKKATIYLVSEMEDAFVRTLFMEPYHSAQAALDDALKKYGAEASVIVMPYGGSTLPHPAEEKKG